MKKVIVLAAALAVGLILAVTPAPATIDGTTGGPNCADIVNESSVYGYDAVTHTLSFVLGTAAPSCKGFVYTVNVRSDNDGSFIGSGSVRGTREVDIGGTGFVIVDIPNVPAAVSYCISATTTAGPHVFDAAPNLGGPVPCISFPVESTGGQSGFN